jgi:hypothetical protein
MNERIPEGSIAVIDAADENARRDTEDRLFTSLRSALAEIAGLREERDNLRRQVELLRGQAVRVDRRR